MKTYSVKCPKCGGTAMFRTFTVPGSAPVTFRSIEMRGGDIVIDEDTDSASDLDWDYTETTGYRCAKCGLSFTVEQFKCTALVEDKEEGESTQEATSEPAEARYEVVGVYDVTVDVTVYWAIVDNITAKTVETVERFNYETHEIDDTAYGRALQIATELNDKARKETDKEEA